MIIKRAIRSRKGFTLIEVIIAMAITALIMGGLTTTVIQIMSLGASDNSYTNVIRNLDTAGHWFVLDFEAASSIPPTVPDLTPGANSLTLTQSVNSPGDVVVVYSIDASGNLTRTTGGSSLITARNITRVSYTFAVPQAVTITAVDGAKTQSKTYKLNSRINASIQLSIINDTLDNGDRTIDYYAELAALGGTMPYLWSVTSGSLPPGLSLDSANQNISGTPTSTGTFNFTIAVTDSAGGTDSNAFSIIINALPSITTVSLPNGTVGAAYGANLASTGGTPPILWLVPTGFLPDGLTLDPTGLISGTPTTSGTSTFVVQLNDQAGAIITKNLSITVNLPVVFTITTPSLSDGTVGTAYSQTLAAANGTTPFTWSIVSGSLPNSLALNANTGVISGTPSITGTSSFKVQVRDALGAVATKTLTIYVAAVPPPTITTASLPDGKKNKAYVGATLTATGGTTPYTWSISAGSLPGTIIINPSTGVLSGNCPGNGTYSFTVEVTDHAGRIATKNLTITVTNSG